MKWTVHVDDHGETLATGIGDESPEECIAELVESFIRDIAPLPHPQWDTVDVNFWLESEGRILIFPADSRKEDRIDIGVSQIFSSALFAESERLGEAEEAGDISGDELGRQYEDLLNRLSDMVESAVRASNMVVRIGRSGLRVRCTEATDPEPFREFVCPG